MLAALAGCLTMNTRGTGSRLHPRLLAANALYSPAGWDDQLLCGESTPTTQVTPKRSVSMPRRRVR